MKNGIIIKPNMNPTITRIILTQAESTFDFKMYGSMIGQKKTRKNGHSRMPNMIKPIVLKTEAQMPLFYCNAILLTPKRLRPQLVSEKEPKWLAEFDASSPQLEQYVNWQKWHEWTMLTVYFLRLDPAGGFSP